MSLRKRKGASGEQVGSTVKEEDDLNDQTQDLMKDHLELMKEVVMRIREDEEFARNIYADCPRLQNLLDRNPDLRPIFEDPNLVRINFEQVYRDAGGVLPEDEKTRAKCLTAMVNSPCFKVLKALFMIKKIMGCIAGGGIGMVTGCFMGMCCCGEDALPDDFDAEDDGDGDGGNPENERNKEALNQAADYMEDPEVQEQMDRLMEDPEGLEEAIENDEELRALRDSNPLCGELMSDPETMKILTEPDNLRALGEAPDLIEADFQDPNWSAPDVEMGEGADFDVDDIEGDDDFEADADDDAEGDDGPEDGDDDDDDDDDDIWEDAELEQQEGGNRAAEGGNGAEGGNRGGEGGNRGGGNAPRNQQQRSQQRGAEGGEGGGIGASIAVAARDLAAGALVGQLLGGSADLFFGGGDDVDGLEDAADDAAEGAGNSFDRVMETTEMFDEFGDNDFADTLEGGMDGGAAAMGADTGRAVQGAVAGGAAGAAIGGGAGAMADRNAAAKKEGEEAATAEGEEEEKKKGGWFGNMTSTVFTAAKEQMAATLLGDDLAEMLVEKIEDKDEDKDEDDKDSDDEDDDEEEEEKSKSKRSLFAKSRS